MKYVRIKYFLKRTINHRVSTFACDLTAAAAYKYVWRNRWRLIAIEIHSSSKWLSWYQPISGENNSKAAFTEWTTNAGSHYRFYAKPAISQPGDIPEKTGSQHDEREIGVNSLKPTPSVLALVERQCAAVLSIGCLRVCEKNSSIAINPSISSVFNTYLTTLGA